MELDERTGHVWDHAAYTTVCVRCGRTFTVPIFLTPCPRAGSPEFSSAPSWRDIFRGGGE